MPFSFNISISEQIAYITAYGSINLRSSVEAITSLADNSEFKPHYKIIVDPRKINNIPTTIELRGITSVLNSKKSCFQNKIALIVTQANQFKAHIACIYSGAFGIQMKEFFSMDAAKMWIISD